MNGDLWHWIRHRWSAWEDAACRVRTLAYGIPVDDWQSVIGQQRRCLTCGKQEIRRLTD